MEKKKLIKISICSIILLTFLAFLPSLNNSFTNWDDDSYLTENSTIQSLSLQNVHTMFTSPTLSFYIPLVPLTYSLEYHFFQLNPLIYHATNLLLHVLNSLLVFWMVFLLSDKIGVSFVTALIFGIHPMHVESVAWVSGRKDVLYAFFFLLSSIYYLYYLKIRSFKYYYASLFAFILSLLAKPMCLLMAFILLVFDYLRNIKFDRSSIRDKIPFLCISIIFASIIPLTLHPSQNTGLTKEFGFFDHLLVANYDILFYLKKMLIPTNLSCFYPCPETTHGFLPTIFLLSPIMVVSLIAVIIISTKFTRTVAFGSLFFFLTLLPVLQLFPVYLGIAADRYTYVPSIGIFYIASEGFFWLYRRKLKYSKIFRSILIIILIVSISILSFLTYQRTKVWKDSITLWTDVLKNYPGVSLVYYNRGNAYFAKADYDQAISDCTKAIELNPNYADAYNNRGNAYYAKADYDQAISDCTKAIELHPNLADAHYNRGNAYYAKADYDQAISDFTKAIELHPNLAEAYNNRGLAYGQKGNFDQAISDFTRAIELNPNYAKVYYNRGIVYYDKGNYDKAISDFSEAITLNPNLAQVYYYRAAAYYAKHEYDKSRQDIRKAESLGYKVDPGFLDALKKASGREH